MKKVSLKKVVAGVAMTTLIAGLATGSYAGDKGSCGKGSCGKSSCGSKGAKKGFFQGMYDWMQGEKGSGSCGKSSCGKAETKKRSSCVK